MNPKVKELAEQAGGMVLAGSEIEKFAELIVRECAEVASDPLAFTEAAYCHARVLKHFGIQK